MEDGGRGASKGFLVQALVALLDSLRSVDWVTVAIEPDQASEKVDIAWTLADGSIRHAQVKYRSRAIQLSDARSWAKALRQGSPSAQCTLYLCGPVSQGVVDAGELEGVQVQLCGHDLTALQAACYRSLHATLDAMGCYGRSHDALSAAIERLGGVLFSGGATERVWTAAELRQEIGVASSADPSSHGEWPPWLQWYQTRIVEIQASGDTVETHITTYRNIHSEPFEHQVATQVQVTDSAARTVAVSDGLPDPYWQAGALKGSYVVWVPPRGAIPGCGVRRVAVKIARKRIAEVDADEVYYSDAVLPPEGPAPSCRVNTLVILPPRWHGGRIKANDAEVVTSGVAGFQFEAEHRRFSVRATLPAAPTTDWVAEALHQLALAVTSGFELHRALKALQGDAGIARMLTPLGF